LFDHARARGPFRDGLGQPQRNEGTAEAHQAGEDEQGAQVQAFRRQVTVDAQQTRRDAQHEHDGEVGGKEKQDPFHGRLSHQ
jgi:hypothetical protein